MPVTYRIDAGRKLIRTTCGSPLTYEEVIGHFRTLNADPTCFGHLDVFLDVSTADTLPQSSQFASINAELRILRQKVQFGACAVVATRDGMFGMMRMFEVVSAQYFAVIRVFRDPVEAEVWLASQQEAASSGC
jgi:hypothetical protein